MLAGGRGIVEGLHDVEDVVGQFTTGAMGSVVTNGIGHVGDAQAATVFGVDVGQRHILPVAIAHATDAHRAAKGVGVGQAERGFRTINFQARQLGSLDIKGCDDRADGAAGKLQ